MNCMGCQFGIDLGKLCFCKLVMVDIVSWRYIQFQQELLQIKIDTV
jgi:hypothetical protein